MMIKSEMLTSGKVDNDDILPDYSTKFNRSQIERELYLKESGIERGSIQHLTHKVYCVGG